MNGGNEIDLWVARWSAPPSATEATRWASVLSQAERERIDRHRPAERRTQALIGRAMARVALSHRLGVPPEAMRIERDEAGRPYIAEAQTDVDFNISHAEGGAVCAVAEGVRVGVDVEPVDRADQVASVAERIFSEEERRDLAALSSSERRAHLVRLWCLKEALAKGCGLGLALEFPSVSFTLEEATARRPSGPPWTEEWRCVVEPLGASHVVALAYRAPEASAKIRRREATPEMIAISG